MALVKYKLLKRGWVRTEELIEAPTIPDHAFSCEVPGGAVWAWSEKVGPLDYRERLENGDCDVE